MYGIIMTALGSRAFLAGTLTHRSVFFEGKNWANDSYFDTT